MFVGIRSLPNLPSPVQLIIQLLTNRDLNLWDVVHADLLKVKYLDVKAMEVAAQEAATG